MRAAAACVFALVLGVGPLAHAEQPGVRGNATQFAYASWLVTEENHGVMYFAAGMNNVPSESPSVGFVGAAKCRPIAHGHHTAWRCRGRSRPTPLNPGDFMVDPLLDGARLTLTEDGFTHEVSWTGRGGPPKPFWHQHSGSDVQEVLFMAWMNRRAGAAGTLFDQELEETRGGVIGERAEGAVSIDYGPNDLDFGPFQLRDGWLLVDETYNFER
ncbi:MAG: hypothetical protein ABR505_12135 [Actinomycetota bacterium]